MRRSGSSLPCFILSTLLTFALISCGGGSSASHILQPFASLTANPSSVVAGQSVVLTWTTTNAVSASIDNGVGAVTPISGGTISARPTATTTYTITATGASGSTPATAQVTVTVVPQPTVSLASNPASIAAGQSATLTWSSSNATSVNIDNGVGTVAPAAGGSIKVSPSITTTYTITASGVTGTTPSTATATVTVIPQPAINGLSPSSIAAGSGDTQLTITGSGFVPGSTVSVGGSALTTSSISSTQIVATILSGSLTLAKQLTVEVSNPAPAGSSTAQISIFPTVVSVSPAAPVVGSAVTVTVAGGDTSAVSNNAITFSQTGRIYSAQPSSATTQGGAVVFTVPLPAALSPASPTASLGVPTSVNVIVNSVASAGVTSISVQPPPHALTLSPSAAEQNTSVMVSLLGISTSFDANTTVSTDDPGLNISGVSTQAPTLVTGLLDIGQGVSTGDHVLTVTSGASAIRFHFLVLAASSSTPIVTSLSASSLVPGSNLSISGSGFLPSPSSSAFIRYVYSGGTIETSLRTTSDIQANSNVPLLFDPSTGAPFVGALSVQLVVNGKPSNTVPVAMAALPPNAKAVGVTTQAYLSDLTQQISAIQSQVTPALPSDQGIALNNLLSPMSAQLAVLKQNVSVAAAGGQVTTADGTTFTQSSVDVLDRLLQSSGWSSSSQSASTPGFTIHASGSEATSANLQPRATQTLSLDETTLVTAGQVCKAAYLGSQMSDPLANWTLGVCGAAAFFPPLAPVAGPICGFLKLFQGAELAIELTNTVCNVAPVNLASISVSGKNQTTVSGAPITISPTGVFKSTGSAVNQVAETTVDLVLERLHLDTTIWRQYTNQKIVNEWLKDAFQWGFTKLVGEVYDTSVPSVYYFQTNPVPFTPSVVTIQPTDNGMLAISGFTMTPGSVAGHANLNLDVSAFSMLDSNGDLTTSSYAVPGDAWSATVFSVVTILPNSATISLSATEQFSASVAGVGPSFGVDWMVDNISGGNASVGTITSAGLYSAPGTTGTHTITATSLFDGSTGSATVTVSTNGDVTISPTSVVLPEGGAQTFGATVVGGGAVNWSIQEAPSGGTITSNGNYTAPQSTGIFHVVATNSADTSRSATASVQVIQSGIITTIAGNGNLGFAGDGGPAIAAELNYPYGVSVDAAGNVYVGDKGNARIRRVAIDGTISTVAGNGSLGFYGDNGPATNAWLDAPYGVTVGNTGEFYIADVDNMRVRKVDANGVITTVAGNGTFGYTGDGGPAISAGIYYPVSMAVDKTGNLYVTDEGNGCIRKVDLTGTITTVAGTGTWGYGGDNGAATSAQLYAPYGVAVDSGGNLYIADTDNNRIRKVDANGIITTIAGTGAQGFSGDGGPATNATLLQPAGVAVDGAGNIFVADTMNERIRKIDTNGVITTIAGTGGCGPYGGPYGDGAAAVNASLCSPYAVAIDKAGNLYVADTAHQRIRKVANVAAATN